jgi:hypothetical protein
MRYGHYIPRNGDRSPLTQPHFTFSPSQHVPYARQPVAPDVPAAKDVLAEKCPRADIGIQTVVPTVVPSIALDASVQASVTMKDKLCDIHDPRTGVLHSTSQCQTDAPSSVDAGSQADHEESLDMGSQTDFFSTDFFTDASDVLVQTDEVPELITPVCFSFASQTKPGFSAVSSATQTILDVPQTPMTTSTGIQSRVHTFNVGSQVGKPTRRVGTQTCVPSDPFDVDYEYAMLDLAVATAASSRGHRPPPRGPLEWALTIMFLLLCTLGQDHGLERHLALDRDEATRAYPTGEAYSEDYLAIDFARTTYRWAYYLSGRKPRPTSGTQTFVTMTRDGFAQTDASSCLIQVGVYVNSTRHDHLKGPPPLDGRLHATAQTDATCPERPEAKCVDHGRRRSRMNLEAAPSGGFRCTYQSRCHDLINDMDIVRFPEGQRFKW